MHTTRVCAHTTPSQRKARPWLDGGVLSVRVPAANRSSASLVETKDRHHCKARERARRRRQRHLQSDRLGSMAGSQATAGLRGNAVRDSGPGTYNELTRLGPASTRRPGPHHREEGGVAHLCSGRDDEVVERVAWNGLEQGKQSDAVHGFHNDIFLVQQPWLLGVPARRRRRCGGAEEEDWGLGLMQGKQSSTTPSPAGPAPIPRWRLDHGWLRLGHRRPWLGLL
jgi:hypothetical protein